MKTVSLRPINRRPQIETNKPILDALLAEEVDVMMACGGRGMCATCHVYVEEGMECLSPMEQREKRTLSRVSRRGAASRLACQARVCGEGVKVRLPKGMYIMNTDDVLSLVGKRAEQAILHPITGAVLVEEGKLITRTYIRQLDNIDMDLGNLAVQSG